MKVTTSPERKPNKDVLIVIFLFFIGTIIRFNLSDFSKSLSTYGDELRYYGIARSLFNGTGLSFRNVSTDYQKIAYSLFLAPFFAIDDSLVRMRIFNFINSILMSISVFPVWLISKELHLNRRNCFFMILLTLLYPDMIFSMTFMSEILYWPLFLWFLYIWIVNRTQQKYLYAVAEGVLCYFGYMCKEIFLAAFLAYIICEFLHPTLSYLFAEKNSKGLLKNHFNRKSLLISALFITTFVSCFLLSKFVIFSGLGNSYDQMGISAILSVYNFTYFFYGFVYFVVAILLCSFIFPIIYPLVNYRKMDKATQKTFCYLLLFLLISSATIAYTITVREDLGKIAPRLHLRYIGPAILMLLVIFFKFTQLNQNTSACKIKYISFGLLTGVVFFICYFFKGATTVVSIDQFTLIWYTALQSKLQAISSDNGESFVVYPYAIVSFIIIILICYFLHFIYLNKSCQMMKRYFTALLVIVYIINNILGVNEIYEAYYINPQIITEVVKINNYFLKLPDESSKLYLTAGSNISRNSKCFDTYFDNIESLYMTDGNMLISEITTDSLTISEVEFREPIYNWTYDSVDSIDYIIVENSVDFRYKQLDHVEIISEISSDYYTVYKNLDPSTISLTQDYSLFFLGDELEIIFSGDKYNADCYVLSGISREGQFSWTDGNNMEVEIPLIDNYNELVISINVLGTFNGTKSFNIRQGNNLIQSGTLSNAGEISFSISPIDGKLAFEIEFPDAQIVNQIIKGSTDNRKLAFQLEKMTITAK